jgi:hypothetical protein
MYVERTNQYEAGERVQGRLGTIVEQENLSIEKMLDIVFGERQAAQAALTKTTKKEG